MGSPVIKQKHILSIIYTGVGYSIVANRNTKTHYLTWLLGQQVKYKVNSRRCSVAQGTKESIVFLRFADDGRQCKCDLSCNSFLTGLVQVQQRPYMIRQTLQPIDIIKIRLLINTGDFKQANSHLQHFVFLLTYEWAL